jgi:hypothetical protein
VDRLDGSVLVKERLKIVLTLAGRPPTLVAPGQRCDLLINCPLWYGHS